MVRVVGVQGVIGSLEVEGHEHHSIKGATNLPGETPPDAGWPKSPAANPVPLADQLAVALRLGVGWATVMRAVREYGEPLVDDPRRLAGVVAIGVDETSFLAANRRHHTEFVTGIVALPGPGRAGAAARRPT